MVLFCYNITLVILCCRYQSIRRTITSRRGEGDEGPADSTTPETSTDQNTVVVSEVINHTPAVKFLSRPDFFSILHMNQVNILL